MEELILQEPWIQTYTGKKFYPFNPKPELISALDIAHALSMICRFVGHGNQFYSVGNHCLLVSSLCPDELKLAGLLHDAAEAYLGDLATPIKNKLPDYKKYEDQLQAAIGMRFGVPVHQFEAVKPYDNLAFQAEALLLMQPLQPDLEAVITEQARSVEVIIYDHDTACMFYQNELMRLLEKRDGKA